MQRLKDFNAFFRMSPTALGFAALLALPACVDVTDDPDGEAWNGLDDDAEDDATEPSGRPDTDDVPTSEIYGGSIVGNCGWPTTVALVKNTGACSGTLVAPQVVMYAAHCGTGYKQARFGEKSSGTGLKRTVNITNCKTFPGGGPGGGDDFAYCKLAAPVTDIPIVPPLMGCEVDALVPGEDVTLVGFGLSETSGYGTKRAVTTTFNGITSDNEAFIGGNGEDTCNGDSGGPAYIQLDDGSWRAFGITSYGGACGTGGYYSMMHNGVSWVETNSGIDITPCHSATGQWSPSAACTGIPFNPATGGGTWATGCSAGAESGPIASCGAPIAGGGGDPPPPNPNSCVGECGGQAPGGCWCDSLCAGYGDCCGDKVAACG